MASLHVFLRAEDQWYSLVDDSFSEEQDILCLRTDRAGRTGLEIDRPSESLLRTVTQNAIDRHAAVCILSDMDSIIVKIQLSFTGSLVSDVYLTAAAVSPQGNLTACIYIRTAREELYDLDTGILACIRADIGIHLRRVLGQLQLDQLHTRSGACFDPGLHCQRSPAGFCSIGQFHDHGQFFIVFRSDLHREDRRMRRFRRTYMHAHRFAVIICAYPHCLNFCFSDPVRKCLACSGPDLRQRPGQIVR